MSARLFLRSSSLAGEYQYDFGNNLNVLYCYIYLQCVYHIKADLALPESEVALDRQLPLDVIARYPECIRQLSRFSAAKQSNLIDKSIAFCWPR